MRKCSQFYICDLKSVNEIYKRGLYDDVHLASEAKTRLLIRSALVHVKYHDSTKPKLQHVYLSHLVQIKGYLIRY